MARRPWCAAAWVALALAVAACGPALTDLSGTVVDAAGRPIEGALVQVGNRTATTDASGMFKLEKLEPGAYTVSVTAPGKLTHTSGVTVQGRAVTLSVTLEDVPFPPGCDPRPGDPEGMTLVYCQPFTTGSTPEELGWRIGSGVWRIVEADGKRWLEGTSDGGQRWAYVAIPALAQAKRIVVEYTATYVSAGNTWAVEFPADAPEQAHGTTFMVLSAWEGVYVRRYHLNNAVAESTRISPPRLMPGEVTTIRVTYDKEAKTIDLLRNGVRPPEYPYRLPDEYLITGEENTLLKLYVNVGGSAGDTTARWTDIRVWVD